MIKVIGNVADFEPKEKMVRKLTSAFVLNVNGQHGSLELALGPVLKSAALEKIPYNEIEAGVEIMTKGRGKLTFTGSSKLKKFEEHGSHAEFSIEVTGQKLFAVLSEASSKNLENQGIGKSELEGGTIEIAFVF